MMACKGALSSYAQNKHQLLQINLMERESFNLQIAGVQG